MHFNEHYFLPTTFTDKTEANDLLSVKCPSYFVHITVGG